MFVTFIALLWIFPFSFPSFLPLQLVLFAEGTRFTEEKHRISVEFAQQRGLPVLKHHLLPRTKGFSFLVKHMKDVREFAVIDNHKWSVTLPVITHGVLLCCCIVGITLFIVSESVAGKVYLHKMVLDPYWHEELCFTLVLRPDRPIGPDRLQRWRWGATVGYCLVHEDWRMQHRSS